ncbi:MAG: hypothetical protein LQ352_004314 [Teloschistes flavicans]|nr:MAG: hypothetical protein LQ352_004314 [Teloschistes flavicans]
MCIALFSTAHPDYALVLINNRDEYLSRPTAPAEWWPAPNAHILGGRDLLRPVQGTWLGITKQGRLAVLTNYREELQVVQEARSRGAMVNAFLMQDKRNPVNAQAFATSLFEGDGVAGVGGFTLVCGQVGKPLAVISNRTPSAKGVGWIAKGRGNTIGLSNAAFENRSWPKVLEGERKMQAAIQKSVLQKDTKEDFIEQMMQVLSIDTLPRRKPDEGWDSFVKELRNSIFIPAIGGEGMDNASADEIAAGKSDAHIEVQRRRDLEKFKDGLSGLYGTQKQTVLLVSHQGHVTFVERTLYDAMAQPIEGPERDRRFEFVLENTDDAATI